MTARLTAVAVALAMLSVWTHARADAPAGDQVDVARVLPLAIDEWIGRDAPPLDPEVSKVLAADQYVHRYYGYSLPRRSESEGGRIADVEMDIAYYARPQAGAAMHSPLSCLPGNGWQVVESRVVTMPFADRSVNVRRLVVSRGANRIAMTYWFQNRGALVENEYRQRLALLSNGLRGRATDAALVRVMALDTPEGHVALDRFTRAVLPEIAEAFR